LTVPSLPIPAQVHDGDPKVTPRILHGLPSGMKQGKGVLYNIFCHIGVAGENKSESYQPRILSPIEGFERVRDHLVHSRILRTSMLHTYTDT
jgi:hypothetical protein